MIYQPRPYQHIITGHELELERCGVWAGMGLGKTAATLSAIDARQLVNARPELVLAPLRVAQSTWPDEAAKWSNLSHIEVQPVLGTAAQREKALRNSNAAVFSINYENIPWLVAFFGDRWPFGHVTADESTKLKSFRLGGKKGQRARSIAKLAHTKIEGWTNLTGTPSPNGLIDLWGQTFFLDAGQRLGRTFTAFEQRWFYRKRDGFGLEPSPIAQDEIEARIKDLHLTVDAKDWFDLEEPFVNIVRVELPAKARSIYQDMEKKMFAAIGEHEVEAFSAAAKTAKCLQIAAGFAWIDADKGLWQDVHDEKLDALQSIVNETSGAPLLIRYHWVPSRERILKAFPRFRMLDKDPQTIRDWNAGKIPGLVAHAESCGHGLNLQDGGHHLVTFDDWWNLEHSQQIFERIGPVRQLQAGHNRVVFHHRIQAVGTLDFEVAARQETKRSVQDLLLEAMKRRAT